MKNITLFWLSIAAILAGLVALIVYVILPRRRKQKEGFYDFELASDTTPISLTAAASGNKALSLIGGASSRVDAIPMTNQTPPDEWAKSMPNAIARAKSRFGQRVREVAIASNIPEEIIFAIMVTENQTLNPSIRNGSYVGLMQISDIVATDFIIDAKNKGLITDEEKVLLRERLGERLDRILKIPNLGSPKTTKVFDADLLDPNFAIAVAGLGISVYASEETVGFGSTRWDRVVSRYANGRNYLKKIRTKNADDTIAKVPDFQPKDYIKKTLGKGGAVEYQLKYA